MYERKILKRVFLKPEKHSRTGFTRHYVGSDEADYPNKLQIEFLRAKADKEEVVYLIHYDMNGNEITDTAHDSVSEAQKQAKDEFRIEDSDWETVDSEWKDIA